MANRNAGKRNRMRRNQMRRRISNVLTVCSVVVLLVCAAYLVNEVTMHVRRAQTADELRTAYRAPFTAAAEDMTDPTATPAPAAEAEGALPTEEPLTPVVIDGFEPVVAPVADEVIPTPEASHEPVLQERFVDMFHQNDDLIGWIHVNDTIDYPMVWREGDNDFYMNHDFDGKSSNSGWIFLDKRNEMFMNDDHLLIYGHNMRLGDMFGDLDLYRDLEYVKLNPIIEIQSAWEEEPRQYALISLFDASMNKSHNTYVKITNFNFETPEDKQAYIDEMYRRSIFDLPCKTTADDQLITLVTCSYSHPNGRFLVVARELREDETAEQIAQMFAELN